MSRKPYAIYILLLALCFALLPMPKKVSATALSKPKNNLGLVGYWPMDENRGIYAGDFSGNGNTGTLTGTVKPTWVNGKYGKALRFDGSTSLVTTSLTKGTTSTFSVWATWSGTGTPMLFNAGETGAGPDLFFACSGKILWNTWDSCSNPFGNIPSNAGDGKFHLYVAVIESGAGNTKLYFDGNLLGTATYKNPATTTTLKIGGNSPSYVWNGVIDDFRVYNRALSPTEVLGLYGSGQVTQRRASNQGLVAYWPMDEARGVKAGDFSGNGNTGTFSGSPAWVDGKHGKALSFNGSSYVDSGTKFPLITSAISISAWVKPGASQTAYADIWGNHQGDYKGMVMQQNNTTLNQFSWGYGDGVNWANTTGVFNLQTNVWQHVVAVKDSQYCYVYINGIEQAAVRGSCPSNIVPATTVNFRIAMGFTSGRMFNGSIDEVRVYNRALSAGEILNLYQTTSRVQNAGQNDRLTNGLVGLWSFNGYDISGATAYDRSGQGNNGTISGTKPSSGKVGQSLSFVYGNSITTPNISLASQPYTVTAWIYKNDSSDFNIVGGGAGGTNAAAHYIVRSSKFYFGNYSCDLNGNQTVSPGQWYHVAFIMDTDQKKSIYVNGVLDAGPTNSCGYYTSYVNKIYYSCCGGTGAGKIDEVRIYNRALSAAEVKQLYNMGK